MTKRHDVDDLLDELRSAVNVEPSPAFEARVRQRVATASASTTRWWWLGAAAAIAATAVVIMMVMPRSGGDDTEMQIEVLKGGRGVSAAAPIEEVWDGRLRGTPGLAPDVTSSHSTASSARPRRPQLPLAARVIVPPGQDEALQQLVVAMWSGQVQSAPRVADSDAQLEVGAIAVPEPIQLSTIRIDPLDQEF